MTALLDVLPQWLTAVGGLAGLGALLRIGIDRRKARADVRGEEAGTSKIVTDTALGLLEPLRGQISYLTAELGASRQEAAASRHESERLRSEVAQLREYIAGLVRDLSRAGLVVPTPPGPLLGQA